MWTGKTVSNSEINLKYGGVWALNEHDKAIVKLRDWGYTVVPLEKKDGLIFVVLDFAASFLKFEFFENSYKKIEKGEMVSNEIIETIEYNFAHAAGVYGTLHPGVKMEGIE